MNRGYCGFYKGIYLRSSYEYAYAQFLDYYNIHWKYEELSYKLSNGRGYKPDFFIYDSCGVLVKVVEVKSRNREELRKAFENLRQLYDNGDIPAFEIVSYTELLEYYKNIRFSLTSTINSWVSSKQNTIQKKYIGSLNPRYQICHSATTKRLIGEQSKLRWKQPSMKQKMLEGSLRGAEVMRSKKGTYFKIFRELRRCAQCNREFMTIATSKQKYCSDVCGGRFGFNKATLAYITKRKCIHLQIQKYVLFWCRRNSIIVLGARYNQITTVLKPLINFISNNYHVKDIRVIIKAVTGRTMGRKDFLTFLKDYIA